MGGCNVLLPVCEAFFEALLCLRHVLLVGDFQVATGGGFWVAIGVKKEPSYYPIPIKWKTNKNTIPYPSPYR
jgi:hypothetical protein